jgi:HEAT repeat protein
VSTFYELSSILKIPVKERMEVCKSIIKKEKDESLRGEAIWVLGATASELNLNDPLRDEIGDLLEFVLIHDNNDIVKHEAVFQIGESKLKKKIYVLVNSALNDPSELVRHEAVEALGLIQAFDQKHVLLKALNDKKDCVRQTAVFVLKQLDRLEKAHTLNENK